MDRLTGAECPRTAAAGPRLPLLFLTASLAAAVVPPALAGAQDDAELPEERPGQPQEAFEILGSANHFALRDLSRGGTGASVALSYLGDLTSDPDFVVRLAVGLQLGLFDDRLRFGLLFPIELDHQFTDTGAGGELVPAFYQRGGGADVRTSLGWMFVDDEALQVYVDLAVWLPTGADPHGLNWTRFAPSLDVQRWFDDRLVFRGRFGAILDASERAEQLGAFGLGLDYVVLGSWTLGVQLDGFGGRSGDTQIGGLAADGDEGVFGLGAGIGSSVALVDWIFLESGFRVAVTDDYRSQLGRYTFTAGIRLADTRHTTR